MNVGKWLIILGTSIAVIGLLVTFASKFGISFGKLPGDIRFKNEKFSFFFPIVSSLVASAVLTILINLIFRFFRK